MLIAVDVGNTQTHIGAFSNGELAHDWRLATDPSATADEVASTFAGLLELDGLGFGDLGGAIVSTVVPQLGPAYEEVCSGRIGGDCLMVGPNLKRSEERR